MLLRELLQLREEVVTGAAETALNLVEDQHGAALLRQVTRQLQGLLADGIDATFALNGLNTEGAHAGIELTLEIVDIVKGYKADARHQRGKRGAVLQLAGRSQ